MKRFLVPLFALFLTIFSGCSANDSLVFTSTVESTQVEVNSEVSGKVLKVDVKEGENIKKGDVLVTLDSSAAQIQVNQAQAALTAANARLDEMKSGSREEQIRQSEAAVQAAKAKLDELKSGTREEQIRQAKASVAQAETAVDTATDNYEYRLKNLKNARELLSQGGVSQQQVDDLQNLANLAEQQLKTSQAQFNSARAQLDMLNNGATPEAIRAAEASYLQAKAQYDMVRNGFTSQSITVAQTAVAQAEESLNLVKLQLEKYTIKSPINGRLIHANIDPGEVVFPGSNVGTVSDISDLWLRFYIPEIHKHRVDVGRVINIKSRAYPNDNIEAEITFVSDEAEFTPKNVETREAKENTVFEVRAKILNFTDKLKPGMTVEVILRQ